MFQVSNFYGHLAIITHLNLGVKFLMKIKIWGKHVWDTVLYSSWTISPAAHWLIYFRTLTSRRKNYSISTLSHILTVISIVVTI